LIKTAEAFRDVKPLVASSALEAKPFPLIFANFAKPSAQVA
jgi:hypothetical protein